MKLVISGGRSYKFTDEDIAFLDSLLRDLGPVSEVIHGSCSGADMEADWWARLRGLTVTPFPADWTQGRSAGPIRNQAMAKYAIGSGQRALCVLFPGGRGTESMRKTCLQFKLQYFLPHGPPDLR